MARDRFGNPRTSGGDAFQITVSHLGSSTIMATDAVTDTDDGSYTVAYTYRLPGLYTFSIKKDGLIELATSPFYVPILARWCVCFAPDISFPWLYP